MALIVWKRSQVEGELFKAEARGYDRGCKEMESRAKGAIDEQRSLYELQIQSLRADIQILENMLDQKDKRVADAVDQEKRAKEVYLKAKALVDKVDYNYREVTKLQFLASKRFAEIREESDLFIKNLLPEG